LAQRVFNRGNIFILDLHQLPTLFRLALFWLREILVKKVIVIY